MREVKKSSFYPIDLTKTYSFAIFGSWNNCSDSKCSGQALCDESGRCRHICFISSWRAGRNWAHLELRKVMKLLTDTPQVESGCCISVWNTSSSEFGRWDFMCLYSVARTKSKGLLGGGTMVFWWALWSSCNLAKQMLSHGGSRIWFVCTHSPQFICPLLFESSCILN